VPTVAEGVATYAEHSFAPALQQTAVATLAEPVATNRQQPMAQVLKHGYKLAHSASSVSTAVPTTVTSRSPSMYTALDPLSFSAPVHTLTRAASWVLPLAPPSPVATLPPGSPIVEPEVLEQQKEAFRSSLKEQKKYGNEVLELQLQQLRESIQHEATWRKREVENQIAEFISGSTQQVDRTFSDRLFTLQRETQRLRKQLEKEAEDMVQEYNFRKSQEALIKRRQEREQQHASYHQKVYSDLGAVPDSRLVTPLVSPVGSLRMPVPTTRSSVPVHVQHVPRRAVSSMVEEHHVAMMGRPRASSMEPPKFVTPRPDEDWLPMRGLFMRPQDHAPPPAEYIRALAARRDSGRQGTVMEPRAI